MLLRRGDVSQGVSVVGVRSDSGQYGQHSETLTQGLVFEHGYDTKKEG